MKDSGVESSKLIKVESLRYLYLQSRKNYKLEKEKKSKQVLILGDYLEADTEKLLSLIEKTVSRYKMKINFLFRPHPACNLNVQSYSKLNLEIARGSFLKSWSVVTWLFAVQKHLLQLTRTTWVSQLHHFLMGSALISVL